MPLDENATHFEPDNGRYDLMTEEEVRTLSSYDLSWLLTCLSELARRQEADGIISRSGGDFEVRHHLYELWLRYPSSDFRLDVIPLPPEPEQTTGKETLPT